MRTANLQTWKWKPSLKSLSHGRLDLGIGRSSFPRSYEGYNIAYEESRARFREYLDVMRLA